SARLGGALVWSSPSGVIAYDGLFGDITIVEPGEVEHRAGLTTDRRRRDEPSTIEEARPPLYDGSAMYGRGGALHRSRQGCALMMHSISSPRRSHLFSFPCA